MGIVSGAGVFFDGLTSEQRDVSVELAPATLRVRDAGGALLAEWAYREIEQITAPDAVLRVGLRDRENLARLEIRDPAFAAALDEMAADVDRTGHVQRRERAKVAILVIAAVASLAVAALVTLPAITARLTPLVPQALERRIGQVADTQLRAMLEKGAAPLPLECGTLKAELPGRAALQSLISKLQAAAEITEPLHVAVLRRNEANAIALPGGRIYVFAGLIAKADTPDELAAAIAHEIGHVVGRDGIRTGMEAAGLSLLFGVLLGDFVGGGAVVVAARSVLQSSYSRDTEGGADIYGVALMNRLGRDATGLARILARIGDTETVPKILLEHPATDERIAFIRSMAKPPHGEPLLDDAAWAALKQICAGS